MSDLNIVQNEIRKIAKQKGYIYSNFLKNIATAKLRMFGIDKWFQCPCDASGERFCISEKCKQDIEKEGKCHCNLYLKKINKENKNNE